MNSFNDELQRSIDRELHAIATGRAVAWKIDNATYLALRFQDDGKGEFNIWWAGCYQSDLWTSDLALIVEEPLLSRCVAITKTVPTHCEKADEYEVGGYGEAFVQRDVSFVPLMA